MKKNSYNCFTFKVFEIENEKDEIETWSDIFCKS